ncbi:type VI secretion system-associated protein TagF [Vibrio owensii]|uniref:type VI secretion system-associated protein TagF n=1 Tax=Vibrio owensii TaxID=696485 RepID=UPI0018F13960|nr:type VI secretion system-associated protein TagF [Vibrio owensii]
MSTNALTSSWGYIGKMPAKGDFVKDGLSQEFTGRWHDWQQAVIAVSREQLGESWSEYFLTAPIWHFALDVSYMEDATYIGSVIPSVDSSGRYFFFTVARAVQGPAVKYWQQSDWTEHSQNLAVAVLSDEFVFDAWAQGLTDSDNLPAEEAGVSQVPTMVYESELSVIYQRSSQLSVNSLLNRMIGKDYKTPCFWWTDGSDNIEPCMLVTSGLPSIGQYSAMLDGNWQKWNW